MDETAFLATREAVFALHGQGDYVAALEIVSRALMLPQLGHYAADLIFWQACLFTRLNRPQEAIHALGEGAAQGCWWAEELLRFDDDLKPLHGDPQFEAFMALNHERYERARESWQPDLRVRLPAAGNPRHPLLIALHGAAGNARVSEHYWAAAAEWGWLVASPQSSQVMGQNRYGWHDAERTSREVQAHLTALRREHPIDEDNVVFGGVLQGAGRAIEMALNGAIHPRGVIAVVPSVRALSETVAGMGSAAMRAYFILGERDLRHADQLALVDALRSHDWACQVESHPHLGHDFPPDFEVSLKRALDFIGGV